MRKFREIPGGKLKRTRGRFGGDSKHVNVDDFEDDLPVDRRSRQERHAQKRALRSAITRGAYEQPDELL